MSSEQKKVRLVWIDLEMTGLDPRTCTILEIGAVVTDNNLEVVAEGPAFVIHHMDGVLDSMEAWSRYHHRKSGLTAESRQSRISLKKAEAGILDFVKAHCREKSSPLCGNTVWQDRRFLVKYMPRLEAYLHYRTIDVSTVKELVGRWYPADFKAPRRKHHAHRVLEDIYESIQELKHYRGKVFVSGLEK